jgi:hypothetical protein
MIKLLKLELKKQNIRTYIISSIIVSIVMLGFLFLFAYAPQIDSNDKDLSFFAGYKNIISLFSMFNMFIFAVLGSVMYSKFIVEDYMDNKLILLFSYPIPRKKVLLSKIMLIGGFVVLAMILSLLFNFVTFISLDYFLKWMNDSFSMAFFVELIEKSILMTISAFCVSFFACALGFIKKSVPTTIVSAMILSSMLSNSGVSNNKSLIYIFAIILICLTVGSFVYLLNKVQKMEVL